jgi:hypothetical protein
VLPQQGQVFLLERPALVVLGLLLDVFNGGFQI